MIHTKANKISDRKSDSWMTSQTKPVGGSRSVIETKANKASMSTDSFAKGAYSSHFSCTNTISGDPAHKYASKKIELA